MLVKGYELVNRTKIPSDAEIMKEGLKWEELKQHLVAEWSDDMKLALYDKNGGRIRKDGNEVQAGTFYDFQAQMPKFVLELKKRQAAEKKTVQGGIETIGVVNKGNNSTIIQNQFNGLNTGIQNVGENAFIVKNEFNKGPLSVKRKVDTQKFPWLRVIVILVGAAAGSGVIYYFNLSSININGSNNSINIMQQSK